jgi:hypothetical protein
MGRTSLWLLVIAGVAVAGCANWSVRTESAPTARSAQYHTYRWTTAPGQGGVDRLVDQRVRDEVAVKLAQKGIVAAAAGQAPDFYVEYSVATGPLLQTVYVDPGPSAGIGASGAGYVPPVPRAMTYSYTRGSLVLDFIDAGSGRVFWRGHASYVMERPPEVSTPKAAEAVSRILRKYPAPQVASAARPSG